MKKTQNAFDNIINSVTKVDQKDFKIIYQNRAKSDLILHKLTKLNSNNRHVDKRLIDEIQKILMRNQQEMVDHLKNYFPTQLMDYTDLYYF